MRTKFEHNWQDLGSDTYRAMIIGGWLVLHVTPGKGNKSSTESMVYIPDRHHEWIHLAKVVAPSEDSATS